ncbi:MAG TPA: ribosome maturation factor RimM [Vicinamibacteria bacterium]|nr:ribosome maturation factor RimM [Vicinamibacteria bacterium]
MPGPRFDELVSIGAIVRPQGRKGEVLVEPLSDRPHRFPTLQRAWLPDAGGGAREARVEACWPHKGRFVLKLAGVDSIDDAEKLRGQELRIGEDDLEALPPGSYYHHQLRGLRVQDPAGRELGRVDDLMDMGAGAPVLVVRGAGRETLIPLAETFVRRVDLEAGVLVAVEPQPVDA